MIPSIPYRIVTTIKHPGDVRTQENRNARTITEAMEIMAREQRKPRTSKVELWVCLGEGERL